MFMTNTKPQLVTPSVDLLDPRAVSLLVDELISQASDLTTELSELIPTDGLDARIVGYHPSKEIENKIYKACAQMSGEDHAELVGAKKLLDDTENHLRNEQFAYLRKEASNMQSRLNAYLTMVSEAEAHLKCDFGELKTIASECFASFTEEVVVPARTPTHLHLISQLYNEVGYSLDTTMAGNLQDQMAGRVAKVQRANAGIVAASAERRKDAALQLRVAVPESTTARSA
jgi:hypothetical protein